MNFWGYSTVNYFSPMARYSAAGVHNFGLGAINEFKHLVREAHKRGIEVTACFRMLGISYSKGYFMSLESVCTGADGCCFQSHC